MLSAPYPRFRACTKFNSYTAFLKQVAPTEVQKFENAVSEMLDANQTVAVSMARTAIYLAIKALVKPGKKVILSPITIPDVINMVICAGAVPVFADVKENSCNIDEDKIEELIDKDTEAVFITHLHGLACEVEAIEALCRKKGIHLIEDSTQAFTTKHNGRYAGTFGDVGIFSFGLYKNINAFYGGMLSVKNSELALDLRREISHFPVEDYKKLMKRAVFGGIQISQHPPPSSNF